MVKTLEELKLEAKLECEEEQRKAKAEATTICERSVSYYVKQALLNDEIYATIEIPDSPYLASKSSTRDLLLDLLSEAGYTVVSESCYYGRVSISVQIKFP
jgi:hypothetical protein